jgi:hypothetical protein
LPTSQGGGWTLVQRATYRHNGKEHEVVLPPGGSQHEDRPATINEAAIAKRYNERQQRQADLDHAFGAK